MGTNFYWIIQGGTPSVTLTNGTVIDLYVERDDPRIHVGKRSLAGAYCRDCDVPLVTNPARVHYGEQECRSLPACPKCGKPNESCSGVCSFSWAQEEATVRAICEAHPGALLIENEYRDALTGSEFLKTVVDTTPRCYHFTHSLGEMFS